MVLLILFLRLNFGWQVDEWNPVVELVETNLDEN